jgi:ATP-dependent protease Clp ATPase subunit
MENHVLRCSFCGLGEGEVARLFEGRAGYICNECVEVCVQVLADYRELGCKPPAIKVPWYKRLFGGEGIKTGHCSFCGAAQGGEEWLLASAETQICERCVRECLKVCEVSRPNLAFSEEAREF